MTSRTKKKNYHSSSNEYEFFEDTGDLLGRLGAHSFEEFNEENSRQALVALETTKPLCHCKVYCYNDRLQYKKLSTFGARPPKKFHKYKDILRFYVFSSDPRVIVLCVQEPPLRKYYFECLKLKDHHDVNRVCDLILMARKDPEYLLRREIRTTSENRGITERTIIENNRFEPAQTPTIPKSSTTRKYIVDDYTSYDGTNRARPLYNYKREVYEPNRNSFTREIIEPKVIQREIYDRNDYNYRPSRVVETNVKNKVYYATKPINDVDSRISSDSYTKPKIEHITSNRYTDLNIPKTEDFIYTPKIERANAYESESNLRRAISNPHVDEDAWAVDVKYIESHPKYGSRISENGPVYMFIAHHLPPERKAYSAYSTGDNSRSESPIIRPKSALANRVNTANSEWSNNEMGTRRVPITYETEEQVTSGTKIINHVPYGNW